MPFGCSKSMRRNMSLPFLSENFRKICQGTGKTRHDSAVAGKIRPECRSICCAAALTLAAERELAGATARIGVAEADLFPHVSIAGAAGYQGQGSALAPNATKLHLVGRAVGWLAFTGFRHTGCLGRYCRSAHL